MLKSDGAGGAWLQRFAAADDHEDANGSTILDYWQASDVARKLARGDDAGVAEAGKPATVADATAAYTRDLRARDGNVANANQLRTHLPPALMTKPVAMLTAREVLASATACWRRGSRARAPTVT